MKYLSIDSLITSEALMAQSSQPTQHRDRACFDEHLKPTHCMPVSDIL